MNGVLGIAMPKVILDQPQVAAADIVKEISPNAWQHVHLIGALNFEQAGSHIDLDALAARYDDPDFWNRAFEESDDSLA